MAIFRKVHTQIWSDPFFSELDNDKKIFYLYLLTNERTKQCGIYEITKKHIAFDLGISINDVSKLLLFFQKANKIKFSDDTNEVALKNWAKYNYSTSPKVVKCIESELLAVKNRVLIEYIYSMDTLSQEEQEEEQEQEEEKTPTPKGEVIDFHALLKTINDIFDREFEVVTGTIKRKYKALLKQGYTRVNIHQAMLNCKNDQFHIDNNYKYCTLDYFSRAKTIDMFGMKPAEPKVIGIITNKYLDQ